MITKSRPKPEKRVIVFDATLMNAMQTCPRQFELSFTYNLRMIGESPEALERGKLFHYFCEVFNLFELKNPAMHSHEILARVTSTLAISLFKKLGIKVLTPEDFWFLLDVFGDFIVKDRHYRTADVPEKTLTRVLYEDEQFIVVWAAKIDVIVDGPGMDKISLDYKTESRRSQPDKKANQFTGQAYVTDRLEIAVQKIGLQKTDNTRKNHFYLLAYEAGEIADWVDNTMEWVKHYLFYAKRQRFPENRTSCHQWARPCQFFRICESPGPDEKAVTAGHYYTQVEAWNPLTSIDESPRREVKDDK